MATYARFQRTATDELGNIQAGATVTVRDRGAALGLATIYSDRTGATPIANPFQNDSNGLIAFYAKGGAYQITIDKSPYQAIWDYVGIGTAQEADINDIAVGVTFLNEWTTATAYVVNSIVTRNGSSYICILGNTSASTSEPGVGATWTTYWAFLAKRGSDAPKWLFSTTTTAADPGTGNFRFNNATPASVTALYINKLGAETTNPSYGAFIAAMINNRTQLRRRAMLKFRSVLNPSKWATYWATGAKDASALVDNTTWFNIALSFVSSAGTFTAGEEIAIDFSPSPDVGKYGVTQRYDATSTTVADPGDGLLRFNSLTAGSVSSVVMDNQTLDGVAVNSLIVNGWNASTSQTKGYLVVTQADDASKSMFFRVFGISQQTGYVQIFVGYYSGVLPDDGAPVTVVFTQKGDAGAANFRQLYDSSSTTMADPGSGNFRTNNATPLSVTSIALDDLTSDGIDVSGFISSFGGSTSTIKGILTIYEQDNPAKFLTFAVYSVVANSGWKQLNGVCLAGSTSLATTLIHQMSWTRAGDAGLVDPRVNYDPSSTTMADPGAGLFRYNNATLASVTNIAVNANDADGNPLINYLVDVLSSSSVVRGYLNLQQQSNPAKRATFRILTMTNNTTWINVSVQYVAGVAFDTSLPGSAPVTVLWDVSRSGDRGSPSGIRWQYSTTTTMADPSAGFFRLNNAAMASATQLAIAAGAGEASNPSLSAWINTWDDSTSSNKGYIIVRDVNTAATFAVYQVGTVTDNTTWLQVPLTYINGNGTFSNNSVFSFEFIRTGDIGQTGPAISYAGVAAATPDSVLDYGIFFDVSNSNALAKALWPDIIDPRITALARKLLQAPRSVATGNTTLVIGDYTNVVVIMQDSSANSVTVPPNSSVAFPVGAVIPIVQNGTGVTSIVAGVGVTIRTFGGKLRLLGQYASASLWQSSADSWLLTGQLQS